MKNLYNACIYRLLYERCGKIINDFTLFLYYFVVFIGIITYLYILFRIYKHHYGFYLYVYGNLVKN
jgi:hypothetical protein